MLTLVTRFGTEIECPGSDTPEGLARAVAWLRTLGFDIAEPSEIPREIHTRVCVEFVPDDADPHAEAFSVRVTEVWNKERGRTEWLT